MNCPRKKTRPVCVGSLIIGGGNPISIQTMWKSPLSENLSDTLRRISTIVDMGCEVLRFACPDMNTVGPLGRIAEAVSVPIVADIHFDYKLALACLDTNVAKIRINPGNVGALWKVKEICKKAGDTGKVLRIGINGGSLPRALRGEKDGATAMLKAAEDEINILEQQGFSSAVFSLKSSRISDMIEANMRFSERYDYPLHIGITEAGPLIQGVVRNSIGISSLIQKGIGDTIRVSLSDSPENEIIAGKAILSAENVYREGVTVISCPTCGRKTFDVEGFLGEIEDEIQVIKKNVTLAVMGCEVNGPEEARHADLGITGAGNKVLLFKKGNIIGRTDKQRGKKMFLEELSSL